MPEIHRCSDVLTWLGCFVFLILISFPLFGINCIDMSCQELYVKEVSENKVNMLLVNKADLLTRQQRRAWARHFEKEGLRAVFWSALAESDRLDAEEKVSMHANKLYIK